MTLEEEGAYIRLLSYCWREGSIPAEPQLLSRLCKNASASVITTVIERFISHPDDGTRLVHKRLDTERDKQEAWKKQSIKGGKRSAKSDKHHAVRGLGGKFGTEPSPNQEPNHNGSDSTEPKPNSSSSSSLSSSSSTSTSSSKKKTDKPPDGRLAHPALQAVRDLRGKYPNKDTWDLVIKTLGLDFDVVRLRECWVAWRAKNYSPDNLAWMVDWYVSGIPQRNGQSQSKADASVEAGRKWIEQRRAQSD